MVKVEKVENERPIAVNESNTTIQHKENSDSASVEQLEKTKKFLNKINQNCYTTLIGDDEG